MSWNKKSLQKDVGRYVREKFHTNSIHDQEKSDWYDNDRPFYAQRDCPCCEDRRDRYDMDYYREWGLIKMLKILDLNFPQETDDWF